MSEMNYDPRHFELPPRARARQAPASPRQGVEPCSEALQLLACCPDGSDLATLAALCSKPGTVPAQLDRAIDAGLVLRHGSHHCFAQGAVRALIQQNLSPERRAGLHLRIGRLLLANTPAADLPASLAPILRHLNAGAGAMPMRAERVRIAALNLQAAEQSRAAADLPAALAYLDAGLLLLDDAAWQDDGMLRFALARQRADCLLLLGDHDALVAALAELAPHAGAPARQLAVARLHIGRHMALGRPDTAMATALAQVSHTGLRISLASAVAPNLGPIDAIWQAWCDAGPGRLADLPALEDSPPAHRLEALATALALTTPSAPGLPLLASLAGATLEHGNSGPAALAYIGMAIACGTRHQQPALAWELAERGLALAQRDGTRQHAATAQLWHASWLLPWHRPLAETHAMLERASHTALAQGLPHVAAQARNTDLALTMTSGKTLAALQDQCEAALGQLQGGYATAAAPLAARLHLVRTLRGVPDSNARPPVTTPDWSELVLSVQAHYYAGDHAGALRMAAAAQTLSAQTPAGIEHIDHAFFCGLAHAAAHGACTGRQAALHTQALIEQHETLRHLSRHCPDNFAAMEALLAAERARLQLRPDAARAYEQAIELALHHGMPQVEALAHELAARFYARQRLTTAAAAHHEHAQQAYVRWGAHGKARQLAAERPVPHRPSVAPIRIHAARVAALGEFAAAVAHEVNQPLAAIVLNAGAALNWLSHTPPDLRQVRQTLDSIVATGTRAGDILACIRRLAQDSAPALAPVRLDDAVREVLVLLDSELRQHAIEVDTELTLDCLTLRADRAQLQQLLMNLLKNASDAVRATAGRQRRITLRTALAADGTALRLSVEDNGCGLAAGAGERLFDALFSTKVNGMGMGLSICRTIAEAHGGRIWCVPRQPHGVAFHLQLPLAAPPQPDAERSPAPRNALQLRHETTDFGFTVRPAPC